MNLFKIGGRVYDVTVLSIIEKFNILYSDKTGRTLAVGAPMTLDPLGTFIGHVITVKPKKGLEQVYDALFDFLAQPRPYGVEVEVIHNQSIIKYEAYVSQGEREVVKVDEQTGKVYWGKMTINIVPTRAQVV